MIRLHVKLLVEKAVKEKLATKTNFSDLKVLIKTVAGDAIFAKTNCSPMIVPVIMSKN